MDCLASAASPAYRERDLDSAAVISDRYEGPNEEALWAILEFKFRLKFNSNLESKFATESSSGCHSFLRPAFVIPPFIEPNWSR